jgi:hypothetical protein
VNQLLLSTDVWVGALIRRAELEGANAVVVKKGDARAGAVIVKAYDTANRSARLWTEATGQASEFESELDAYLDRQRRYDPDLWIIEIEDRQGRHFLTEKTQG